MSTVTQLVVEPRAQGGKGQSRDLRRMGKIPAIIYGGTQAPQMCAIDPAQLRKELSQPGFFTKLFQLQMGSQTEQVLARDVQWHPVKDTPMHVDFWRVSKSTRIHVAVPVEFINEDKSPGIKRGGVLNIVHHELELTVSADSIPEKIVIDLAGLNINDSVHIDSITFPGGAVPTHPDRDYTIVTIAPPTADEGGKADAAGA